MNNSAVNAHSGLNVTNAILSEPSLPQISFWTLNVCIICFNITVFLVVPRVSSLQNSTGKAMLSLASTDTCMGIWALARVIFQTIDGYLSLQDSLFLCKMDAFFMAWLASISIVTLTFINIDKLCTLSYPLRYPLVMT